MGKIIKTINTITIVMFRNFVTPILLKKGYSYVAMFHDISDNNDRYSITPNEFEEYIKSLLDMNVTFTTELQKLFSTKNSVMITFDDGFKSVYDVAYPILKKYNIPFVVFIIVDKINEDNYMSDSEIRKLDGDSLCICGSHSKSHMLFRGNHMCVKLKELLLSKAMLSRLLGHGIDYYAFPYGSIYAVDFFSKCLSKKIYKNVFSTIPLPCVFNSLCVPRIDMPYYIRRKYKYD